MSSAHRRTTTAIIDQLLARPQRFNFFQAVSLLLQHLQEQGVALDKALVGHVRFENSVSLAFPASDIEALRVDRATAIDAASRAVQGPSQGRLHRVALTPTFMGFLGLHGALPNHYTQAVADLQHSTKDEGVRAFLDIFQTRIVALFYQAWRKYRIEYTIGCEIDEFLPLLLSLTGLRAHGHARGAALSAHEEVAPAASDGHIDTALFGHYAGLLRQRPVSGNILASVLTDYFGVPITAHENVGYWDDLADDELWRHGAPRMVLGERTVLGARMWRPDLRVRLTIGPLTRAQFNRFGPKTTRIKALTQLLAVFGSPTLSYEVALVLRAHDVESLAFAAQGARQQTFGDGTFLCTRPSKVDRVGMRFALRPLAPLPPRHTVALAPSPVPFA